MADDNAAKFKGRVQSRDGDLYLVLPEEAVDALGLCEGDTAAWHHLEDRIVLSIDDKVLE